MNFSSLVKLTANITHFDLPLLVQAFDDPRESIRVQLSRWNTQGKIIGLRRGVYTLAEPYRSKQASPSVLPFLERPRDAELLNAENLNSIL